MNHCLSTIIEFIRYTRSVTLSADISERNAVSKQKKKRIINYEKYSKKLTG